MSWLLCIVLLRALGGDEGVNVSFWIIILSGYMPRSEIAGSCGSSGFLVFWVTSILFSILAAPAHIPTTVYKRPLSSTPSPVFVIRRLFNDSHSDSCEVVSHCGFDLHFCNNLQCWASFHVPVVLVAKLCPGLLWPYGLYCLPGSSVMGFPRQEY